MRDNIFAMSLLLPKNEARNWTSFWAVPTFTYGPYQVQSCLALTLSEASRVHLPVSSTSSSTPSPSLLLLSRIKVELASSTVAPHINGFVACVEQPHHCEISKITLCQASTLFMADSFTLRPGPILLDRLLLIPYDNAAGSKSSGSSLDDDVCDWGFVVRKKSRVDEVYPTGGEGSSCRELARVILKLGEVYERIEGAKQRMMVELEKQRMEAAKEIELQRMNMLMDMQMELERSKLAKRRTAASELPTDFRAIHVLP
ncbi:hypothetical protein YC2023_001051 [Brassica napus]